MFLVVLVPLLASAPQKDCTAATGTANTQCDGLEICVGDAVACDGLYSVECLETCTHTDTTSAPSMTINVQGPVTDPIKIFKPGSLTFNDAAASAPQISLQFAADVVLERLTTYVPILPVRSSYAWQIKTINIYCATAGLIGHSTSIWKTWLPSI
jgi:hypothetical protein